MQSSCSHASQARRSHAWFVPCFFFSTTEFATPLGDLYRSFGIGTRVSSESRRRYHCRACRCANLDCSYRFVVRVAPGSLGDPVLLLEPWTSCQVVPASYHQQAQPGSQPGRRCSYNVWSCWDWRHVLLFLWGASKFPTICQPHLRQEFSCVVGGSHWPNLCSILHSRFPARQGSVITRHWVTYLTNAESSWVARICFTTDRFSVILSPVGRKRPSKERSCAIIIIRNSLPP
jgi:hypothetical protein